MATQVVSDHGKHLYFPVYDTLVWEVHACCRQLKRIQYVKKYNKCMNKLLTILILVAALGAAWLYLSGGSLPTFDLAPEVTDTTAEQERVTLYYYSRARDTDERGTQLCSKRGLVPVARAVPKGATLEDVLRLLLAGERTDAELAGGVEVNFPLVGFRLVRVEQEGRKAILTFEDSLGKTSGSACRAAILWAQIEATALAYPGVLSVEFRPETLFQP